MDKEKIKPLNDENKNATFNTESKHPVYKAIKKIGQGSFGKAYLVES